MTVKNFNDYQRLMQDEGREVADATLLAEIMAPHYVLVRCRECGEPIDVVPQGEEYEAVCERCAGEEGNGEEVPVE
jgi:formylmethanofuran dehydrogenase subunit E